MCIPAVLCVKLHNQHLAECGSQTGRLEETDAFYQRHRIQQEFGRESKFCDSFNQNKEATMYVTGFWKNIYLYMRHHNEFYVGRAKSDTNSNFLHPSFPLVHRNWLCFEAEKKEKKETYFFKVHKSQSLHTIGMQTRMTKSGTMETHTLVWWISGESNPALVK